MVEEGGLRSYIQFQWHGETSHWHDRCTVVRTSQSPIRHVVYSFCVQSTVVEITVFAAHSKAPPWCPDVSLKEIGIAQREIPRNVTSS
jgi:hypothetical protein